MDAVTSNSLSKFDLVILWDENASLDTLYNSLVIDFPNVSIKIARTTSRLKLPPPSAIPLIFVAEVSMLHRDGLNYLKRLRQIVPNIRICLVSEETKLLTAFDEFGKAADDVLPLDDELPASIRHSINRILSENPALLQSYNRFQLQSIPTQFLLDGTFDVVFVVDGDGLVLAANDNWIERFPNPNLERTYISDLIHRNDVHRLEADLQLAILDKTNNKSVFRIKSTSGGWETIQTTISGYELEGIHVAIICGRIVTELHRTKTDLQETEFHNGLLRRFNNSLIYRYNPENRNIFIIADKPLEVLGYSVDNLTDKSTSFFEKLVAIEDRDLFQNFLENLVRRGSGYSQQANINHLVRCSDGALLNAQHTIDLDWNRDGSSYWINGSILFQEALFPEQQKEKPNDDDRSRLFEALLEGFAELRYIENPEKESESLQFLSCNSIFEKITGIPRNRIIGSHFCELFPGLEETPLNIDSEETLPKVLAEVACGKGHRKIDDYFWPHLRVYVNISATCIQPSIVSVMFTDVTRRKHAEIRLATLLQGLPDTALYQTGGGIEYISDGITNMLGFSPEVFQKDRNFFVELIHPDDRHRIYKAQTQWISKGSRGVLEMEFRARHRDGHYIWLLDRMSKAFTTPDGRQSSQGVMIDITARKQLEEERQVEVAEMEAVFKALPDLLFRIDKDGVILNYRAGREDYLFVKPEKFLNKSMFDVLPQPVGDQCRFAVEQTLKNRQQTTIEYTLSVPAGKRLFEAKFFYITDNLITVVIRTL